MMKAKSILMVIGLGLWQLSGWAQLQAREPSRTLADLVGLESKVEAVARKVQPATVALLSERTGSSGSGVLASEDGLILTAAHVVQGAEELLVVFPDGKQVQGKVLGANYSKDIAMVQITRSQGKWPFVALGSSKALDAGDWVVALGHSAGFDAGRSPPVRFGRVVSKGPGNFLTTDCTLIGGDSGGPLFDLDGRIIGIHSSIGQSLTNNNHAGIDGFREDWDRIRAGETWGALSMNPFANPEMPVLGIGMAMMRGVKGVIVESVVAGSPAAASGVRMGDVIRTLDGSVVRDGGELLQILAKRQAGDLVNLGLVRDKENMEVKVTLKRRNELYEQR
jgi:serine protease Do